jgi:hypothetical protein
LKHNHKVDVIIDDKRIATNGERVELKIDGVKVFSQSNPSENSKSDTKNLQWTSVKFFLKASDSAFSHSERFRILKYLTESPRSFTEIKELLGATSATADFHIKKLVDGMIVYKNDNDRYALTLLGELVLDYFSRFLKEASRLQEKLAI